MGQLSNPKTFTCVRCGIKEEALPTGTTDVLGGTHFSYHTPKGWWNITTEGGMVMFCSGEDVDIVTDEIIEAMDNSDYRAETGGS
jgi:hypothetical protein